MGEAGAVDGGAGRGAVGAGAGGMGSEGGGGREGGGGDVAMDSKPERRGNATLEKEEQKQIQFTRT